ncbi:MAG TPA: DUF4976 domain-containing protein, partial [Planctomycetes bacterium]|nr:DUF4976 domain-containing protein [Planctomycetota bacterium]
SALFRGSKTKWDDIAFIRSTSGVKPWLAAVTDRYKLIYSALGQPWLYDLKTDPDELHNKFINPDFEKIVRRLTVKLGAYAKRHNDPYTADPQIKADMAQALGRD